MELNELFIATILSKGKRGVYKDELFDTGAYTYFLNRKQVSAHIKEAKKRGLYTVPNMSNDLSNTYYQC